MKDKIVKAYDGISPSLELIEKTKLNIEKAKKKKRNNIIRLTLECACAAVFCFIIGVSINAFGNNLPEVPTTTASVFSGNLTYITPIIIFVLLCTAFIISFIKRTTK